MVDRLETGLAGRRAILTGATIAGITGLAWYAANLASRVDEVDAAVPITVGTNATAAIAPGSKAPDFTATDMQGRQVRLFDFAGRPVWINVWASWCPPCRAELPDIVTTFQDIVDRSPKPPSGSPALLLVSIGEETETVRKYVSRIGLDLPVLVDPEYRITGSYRITGLPTHFFIGSDGVLHDFAIGGLKPKSMRSRLDRLVGR